MKKINHLYQILIENKDFNKYQDEQSTIKFEKYKEAFLEFIAIGSVKDLNLIMASLDDWENEGTLLYNFLDELIGFGKLDGKNFVNNFLQNLHLMYPHAKKGIHYIFNHLLAMEQFLPYLYNSFLTLDTSEKGIFKEIYEEITKGDSLIPKIDEALKSIE